MTSPRQPHVKGYDIILNKYSFMTLQVKGYRIIQNKYSFMTTPSERLYHPKQIFLYDTPANPLSQPK